MNLEDIVKILEGSGKITEIKETKLGSEATRYDVFMENPSYTDMRAEVYFTDEIGRLNLKGTLYFKVNKQKRLI